ncbi:Uncharacterised protein [Serratia fonticola]|uniref:Uncharacterized protein n=1 Tax=Serratia fonticola TaxID=47917 RepID=A0A4U9TKL8_SERFO|nr:Uncharacterised protein [Serratia fonticola]
MAFGFHMSGVKHAFISPGIAATVLASSFKSTALTMTGLKVVHQNAACWFTLMTLPVG